MRTSAFIGDIHGCLQALDGLLAVLDENSVDELVFLGDYINKGPDSAGVMGRLIDLSRSGNATLLRGNHEAGLLHALDRRDLTQFLKMGGAATIRSYVGGDVGADVYSAFVAAIPASHIEAIRRMERKYKTRTVVAQHEPRHIKRFGRFAVSAHRPSGHAPNIGARFAMLDTGSGEEGGRLTAFLWPSRSYLQVDGAGRRVH